MGKSKSESKVEKVEKVETQERQRESARDDVHGKKDDDHGKKDDVHDKKDVKENNSHDNRSERDEHDNRHDNRSERDEHDNRDHSKSHDSCDNVVTPPPPPVEAKPTVAETPVIATETLVTTTVDTVTTVTTVETPIAGAAKTVLSFESAADFGVTPMSHVQGTAAPTTAIVTDQFLDQGVLISDAAVVNSGFGHAASGYNTIASININDVLDYDEPITFTFMAKEEVTVTTTTVVTESVATTTVTTSDTSTTDPVVIASDTQTDVAVTTATETTTTTQLVDGTVDYFAYTPDRWGSSGNTVTITAYDVDGGQVGQVAYTETGSIYTPIVLTGVGEFHSVTVDQTLNDPTSGGIALDLITFGSIDPVQSLVNQLVTQETVVF